MPDFSLGAIQSPPDARDFHIAARYAALGITPTAAAALPSRYLAGPMPGVLDQGLTPQCVAFSNAAEQAMFDWKDQHAWFAFDEGRFFAAIGGGPNGAALRAALDQRLHVGYPTVGHDDAALHKIASYYAVPGTLLSIKQAIHDFGPLVLATPWYQSWFTPAGNGRLPAASGGIVGGHAIVAWGWDDRIGLLLRNSWSKKWGMNGNCYMPYAQVSIPWEWWRAEDVIEKP